MGRQVAVSLHEQFARVGKAVSSPRRLELLSLLSQAERMVEALTELTGMTLSNTSAHLQVLRNARLVEIRKDGTKVFYRLASDEVARFLVALEEVAGARLAEVSEVVRRHLADPEGIEPVGREELLDHISAGDVVVVDVRPPEEYLAGHIVGALSIPIPELGARLGELPPDVEVIVYCRGIYCELAGDAVQMLRANGRRARRLVDGLTEWRLAGLPVTTEDLDLTASL